MKVIKYLIPKALLCFVIIFIIGLLLTKIGGSFPNYPPTEKRSIPWDEVIIEIPFLIITSFFVSIIFSIGLYWHWLSKANENDDKNKNGSASSSANSTPKPK
ncbi:MAG: hypothetical protein ACOCUV_01695 [bacterium]